MRNAFPVLRATLLLTAWLPLCPAQKAEPVDKPGLPKESKEQQAEPQKSKADPKAKPEAKEEKAAGEKAEDNKKDAPKKEKAEEKKKDEKPKVVPLKRPKAKGPVDLDNDDLGYEAVALLTKAMETIRTNYVDKDKVTYDKLMDGALKGMLKSLDPHCQYVSNEALTQVENKTSSTYQGIGFTVAMDRGELAIVSVREDGPAAEAGILPGDRILKVGEHFTSRIGITEAILMLGGRPGEKVDLTLRRPGTGEILAVEVVRRVIKQETVRDGTLLAKSMAGGHRIGYVRLLEFGRPTAQDLAEAIDEIEKGGGLDALVLDLRNNPGGLLNVAVAVVGEFVEPGKIVVTTRGRSPAMTPPPHRTPKRGGGHRTYPLAVLINHNSASGSELVAGALQDLHRAVIVGETSFGKGSVQSMIPLAEGKALRLTTAKYYTPSKKTIHEAGILPNIPATLGPEAEKRIFTWWRGVNRSDDLAGEIARLDDNQLQRAVDALKGVLVYQSMQQTAPADQVEVDLDKEDKESE